MCTAGAGCGYDLELVWSSTPWIEETVGGDARSLTASTSDIIGAQNENHLLRNFAISGSDLLPSRFTPIRYAVFFQINIENPSIGRASFHNIRIYNKVPAASFNCTDYKHTVLSGQQCTCKDGFLAATSTGSVTDILQDPEDFCSDEKSILFETSNNDGSPSSAPSLCIDEQEWRVGGTSTYKGTTCIEINNDVDHSSPLRMIVLVFVIIIVN